MAERQDGRMAGWQNGRMAERRDGRMAGWSDRNGLVPPRASRDLYQLSVEVMPPGLAASSRVGRGFIAFVGD